MRIVSVLHKLQYVSNHVLINYAAATKLCIHMFSVGGDMLLDQQVHTIKPTKLTNQLETHKTHKWWSNWTSIEQSWVYTNMNAWGGDYRDFRNHVR